MERVRGIALCLSAVLCALAAPRAAAGGTTVPQPVLDALAALQTTAKRPDLPALERLLSDPVHVRAYFLGQTVDARKTAKQFAQQLAKPEREMVNPFLSVDDFRHNILRIQAIGNTWKVRVQYRWDLQVNQGMRKFVSQKAVWQVSDLHLGPGPQGLVLRQMDFIPADFGKAVVEKLLAWAEQNTQANEQALLGEYTRLAEAFIRTAVSRPDAGGRTDRVTLPGAPTPPVPTPRELVLPDGTRYLGGQRNGAPHGYGVLTWPQGARYMGWFREGKRDGWGRWVFADSGLFVGQFRQNVAAGGWYLYPDLTTAWASLNPDSTWRTAWPTQGRDVAFNDGRWHDLSAVFREDAVVHFITDCRAASSAAEITLWAAYARPQDFALRGIREPGRAGEARTVRGQGARLEFREFVAPGAATSNDLSLAAAWNRDGLPAQFRAALRGRLLCRIHITAPDDGDYASYVLAGATPAEAAFGMARLDDGGRDPNRARVGTLGRPVTR